MKKILIILGIIIILGVAALFLLLHMKRAVFVLINHTNRDIVEVQVFWRDKSMKIEGMKPDEIRRIYINDEAGAVFRAKFTDYDIIDSDEIYFTGNVKVDVDIYDDRIELESSLEY